MYPSHQSVTSKIRFHHKIVWHDGVRLASLGKGSENNDDSELR